LHLQGPE
jgi:hypothetical protein